MAAKHILQEGMMPSDGDRIGAFVLFYEYIRLDIVGTIPALESFLKDARENGRDEPIQYFLNVPKTKERSLRMTEESQRVWNDLKESSDLIDSMERSDRPMQFTWFPPGSGPDQIQEQAKSEEFVFFITHSMIGPAYKLSLDASFPEEPLPAPWVAQEPLPAALVPGAPFKDKFTHRYAGFFATHLKVKCSAVRPSTPIAELFELQITPPGLLVTTECNGKECYTYEHEVADGTSWDVIVSAVDRKQQVIYNLQGVPGVKGEFVFNPFKP